MSDEHLIDDDAEFSAAFDDDDEREPVVDEGDTDQAADEETGDDMGDSEGDAEPEDEFDSVEDESEGEAEPEEERQQEHDELPEDVSDGDVQRYKSWEGRLKRREQELRELEQRLKEREAEIEASTSNQDKEDVLTDIGDDDIDAFLDEFPEMRGPLLKLIQQEVQKAIGQVEQKVESVTEAQRRAEAEAHIAAISERHPDWREIVPEIDAWIESLPYRDAQEFIRIKQGGTTAEVIAMLDRFKSDRKREQEREKLRKRRNQQKQAGQAVPNYPSRVGNMAGSSDPDDFDSGWELPA
ncbi:MAG: hypothetical protein D6694_04665 [Gammaproteobacteria bacterium]|nr:MAG: hypothetical protein D6694_04665 [Gammaproteobacteria bacterium]